MLNFLSVSWQFRSNSEITRVLPHPLEDIFTVIAQPYSEDGAVRTTSVLHFKPTSKEPLVVYSLPFRFREVAWNALDENCQTVIGITTTWNVVECGESIRNSDTAGNTAQSIDLSSGISNKRNLFRDMFGNAAFEELASGSLSIPPPQVTIQVDGSSLLSTFDRPAYMAPPIEAIYSTLIENYLTNVKELQQPVQDPQDTDVDDMAVDEDVGDTLVRQRIVDEDELNAVIEVFKAQSMTCESQSISLLKKKRHLYSCCLAANPKKAKVNGLTNGHHNVIPASLCSRSPSPVRADERTVTSEAPSKTGPVSNAINQPSSDAFVGKKRKKSTV